MNDLPRSLNVPVNDDAANTVIDPVNTGALEDAATELDDPPDAAAFFDEELHPDTTTATATNMTPVTTPPLRTREENRLMALNLVR
jgi:hypothetical protein